MVIGPCLEKHDLSPLVGDMGLTWMEANRVFCLRSKKELSACTVSWLSPKYGESTLTLAASTDSIILKALESCKGLQFQTKFYLVNENTVYRLQPQCLYDCGPIPVNVANEHDEISSAADLLSAGAADEVAAEDPASAELSADTE